MHAALQTVELLLDVFSYLDYVDLAVVARTCSEFSDPALGYLWQHLAVFGPIVRLLPDAKISTYRKQSESWIGDEQREEYCYQVTGRLSNDDMARVRYYASFVKSFQLWQYTVDISADDLQKVLNALRDVPLFPNLRTFDYEGPSDFTPLLLPIIGTCLNDLKMNYNFGRDHDVGIWAVRAEDVDYTIDRDTLLAIKERKPRAPITKLFVFTSMTFPDFLRPILTGWDELEELVLESRVEPPLLMAIARLPSLRLLSMAAPDGLTEHLNALQSPCTHNDTLVSLRLCGSTVKETLSVLSPTSLSDLRLSMADSATAFRAACMRLLESNLSPSLEKMALEQFAGMPNSEEANAYLAEPLFIQHIQPMFFFRGLIYVGLGFHIILLTDDDMLCMAKSWPCLQHLSITHTSTMDPSCTLSGILAFAQYCHDLVHLHLPLDATELVVPEPAAIPFPCAHQRLRTLHVADSPISSPGRVASFLTRFFPNLGADGLIAYPRDEGREKMWSVVRQLIPTLLDARMTGIHGGVKPA
ncbi:hypothetical protein EV715DRAFT_212308 [Schizophyllum commune]